MILEFWYWLVQLIVVPLDGICVNIFNWLEGVADAILEAFQPPTWEPAWWEISFATPIFMGDMLTGDF